MNVRPFLSLFYDLIAVTKTTFQWLTIMWCFILLSLVVCWSISLIIKICKFRGRKHDKNSIRDACSYLFSCNWKQKQWGEKKSCAVTPFRSKKKKKKNHELKCKASSLSMGIKHPTLRKNSINCICPYASLLRIKDLLALKKILK